MSPDPTPLDVVLGMIGGVANPKAIMAVGEGASVLLANDVKVDDPRAINLPLNITYGNRADLEALGFVWCEEPPAKPSPTAYAAVVPPEYWTVTVRSMYLTVIHDERGVVRVLVYDNHQWWDRHNHTQIQDVGRSAVNTLVSDEAATLASVRWHALTPDEQATGLAELRKRHGYEPDNQRISTWLERLGA